jgi:hypothetical protein
MSQLRLITRGKLCGLSTVRRIVANPSGCFQSGAGRCAAENGFEKRERGKNEDSVAAAHHVDDALVRNGPKRIPHPYAPIQPPVLKIFGANLFQTIMLRVGPQVCIEPREPKSLRA